MRLALTEKPGRCKITAYAKKIVAALQLIPQLYVKRKYDYVP